MVVIRALVILVCVACFGTLNYSLQSAQSYTDTGKVVLPYSDARDICRVTLGDSLVCWKAEEWRKALPLPGPEEK